ncbi:MAG TPA: SEC-C metal-binding domain-containing protein [bacterium]
MNLENTFKNKKQWRSEDIANFLDIARAQGKTAFITMIDDPNSPEGQAVKEYIDSHHLLPPNYQDTSEEVIAEQGAKLFDLDTTIAEKKRTLMLLAHLGVYESYQILKKYNQHPDKELIFWAKMALDECRTFVKQNLSNDVLTSLTLIGKIGRNDLCPCGSGKKFKKCCGKNN